MRRVIAMLFGACCLVAIVTMLNACSDDDVLSVRNDVQLKGTWEVTECQGKPWHGFEEWDAVPIITFKGNGKIEANNGYPPYLVSGTYVVEDKLIKIYGGGKLVDGQYPTTIMQIEKISKDVIECVLSGGYPWSSLAGLELKLERRK